MALATHTWAPNKKGNAVSYTTLNLVAPISQGQALEFLPLPTVLTERRNVGRLSGLGNNAIF